MLIRVMAQARPARVYEGARCYSAPEAAAPTGTPRTKEECGRRNDKRPSSKPRRGARGGVHRVQPRAPRQQQALYNTTSRDL